MFTWMVVSSGTWFYLTPTATIMSIIIIICIAICIAKIITAFVIIVISTVAVIFGHCNCSSCLLLIIWIINVILLECVVTLLSSSFCTHNIRYFCPSGVRDPPLLLSLMFLPFFSSLKSFLGVFVLCRCEVPRQRMSYVYRLCEANLWFCATQTECDLFENNYWSKDRFTHIWFITFNSHSLQTQNTETNTANYMVRSSVI